MIPLSACHWSPDATIRPCPDRSWPHVSYTTTRDVTDVTICDGFMKAHLVEKYGHR